MSRIQRAINIVMDSIEELDMIWLEDFSYLLSDYTDLKDDSAEQDAAMYLYTEDGIGLFDLFTAASLYCADYHDGKYSDEYGVLSELKKASCVFPYGSIGDQDESIQGLYARMEDVYNA